MQVYEVTLHHAHQLPPVTVLQLQAGCDYVTPINSPCLRIERLRVPQKHEGGYKLLNPARRVQNQETGFHKSNSCCW